MPLRHVSDTSSTPGVSPTAFDGADDKQKEIMYDFHNLPSDLKLRINNKTTRQDAVAEAVDLNSEIGYAENSRNPETIKNRKSIRGEQKLLSRLPENTYHTLQQLSPQTRDQALEILRPKQSGRMTRAVDATNRFIKSATAKLFSDRVLSKPPRYVASYNPSRSGYTEVNHEPENATQEQQSNPANRSHSPTPFENGLKGLTQQRFSLKERINDWKLETPEADDASHNEERSEVQNSARSRGDRVR